MAVEKMAMLSIVGRESQLDKFVAEYLINNNLHPENATEIFENGWNLSSYTYEGEAKEEKKKCEELMARLGIDFENLVLEDKIHLDVKMEALAKELGNITEKFDKIDEKIDKVNKEMGELEKIKAPILHLNNLNFRLEQVYDLRYMRFRFGRMDELGFYQLQKKINQLEAIVLKVEETDDDVWVIYMTTEKDSAEVDGMLNMMGFERIWIDDKAKGFPKEYIAKLDAGLANKQNEINLYKQEFEELKEKLKDKILKIYECIRIFEKIYDTKKFMAHDTKGSFYVVGWIPVRNLKEIIPRLRKDKYVRYVVKSDREAMQTPPTKLKNNFLVRPFENLVEMYGLPRYTEVDPTSFVAITAFLMFGLMFGDVGQGAIIALLGLILARKKISLGNILIYGGLSSIIFGFAYGSIFGREDILHPLIISPMGNINTMLIFGIVTGGILILAAMIINMINGFKAHDIGRVLFDKNGAAGVIFYIAILVFIGFMVFLGKRIVPITVLVVILLIPLVVIFFKDTIISRINKRKKNKVSEEEKAGGAEKSFDLLETLLSFASNTISFVRLSAFAINHVGLCMAVYILGGMVSSGSSWIVAIIGNVIIIGLEGLIVGIQVLRLEYYELFSRFYSGDGYEYKPI